MRELAQRPTFKYDKDMELLTFVHPILFYIIADMNLWAYENGLPFEITRTVDEKIPGVSVSTTHQEGRAIDVSVRGWGVDIIDECIFHFNNKYSEQYGAFSYSDGKPRLIPPPDHAGANNLHLHIQIRRFR